MPSLFKNSSSKALLLILNLSFHLIFHIQVSEAALAIDTASLSTSDGTIIKAITALNLAGSSAGDFNGDGNEDILIGTPKVSSSNGLAYVIFGTATGIPTNINLNSLSTSQGITYSYSGSGGQVGFSVSALGDINGDLIDDIIIGAYGTSKAYVIFGRRSGLSNIDLYATDISTTGQGIVLSGPSQLGYQVGSAGDFNNDNIKDFMVSAPLASSNQGAVYVIFGKSTIATSFSLSPFTLTASQGIQILGQANSKLGYSLSSAGDFNNDGISDIMMGTNIPGVGMVAIVYGTSTPGSISDVSTISPSKGVVITGTSSNVIGAKNSISSAGDFNNDGVTDVALGVPTYGTNVGLTYVIYGKSGGFSGNIDLSSSYNGFQITGDSSGAAGSFGTAVTSADINGDSLSDLIVGAPTATAPAGTTAGIVYVLFGNRNGFANLDFTQAGTAQLPQVLKIYGDTAAAQLGMDLSFAKDLNKDGVNDLIMLGSPEAYIIYGSGCTSVTQCTSTTTPICYASEGCTCSLDLSELFQDNQCVGTCDTGYYSDGQICELCPALCLSCTSSSDCQTCTSGDTPQGGSCSPCSGATYYDTTTSACKNCPTNCATCTSATTCQTCVTGGFTVQSGLCKCPTGTYLDSSASPSSCTTCPSYCASCTDSSTCQTCVSGGFTVQSGLCKCPTGTYPDASLPSCMNCPNYCATCTSSISCQTCNTGGFTVQSGLCKCPAGTYLDSSTTPSSCSSCPPYCATCTSSTICQTCNTGEFTVQNGLCNCPAGTSLDPQTLSCVSTSVSCPSFCASCTSSSNCDICVSGFVVQYGLCECPMGSYLDGLTCTTCPSYCASCTDSSTCQTCVSGGFTVQSGSCQCPEGTYLDGSTCQSSLDENNLNQIKTINSIKDATNTVNSAGLTAASALAPKDPGSVTAGMLAKMLQYIKYLNIPYSQRLELTFKDLNSTYGPFGVGPKMPRQAILDAPFHEIPERFVKFNVVSNFLVNFWDSLIFIAILSAVLSAIVAAEFVFVQIKKKPAPSILKLVRLNGQNFFMMQFYNVFGDVLLYITLDFRTVAFSSREAVLSFFVSILFTCTGCTILAIHFYILIRFSTFRKSLSWTSTSKKEEFSKQYEGVDVFFKHFKDDTFINQSFLLLFVIRNCLFNLVLGLMYSSPPLQASLILAMSALMLIYLAFLRSFNTVVNLLQNITCELILLIVNTCVLMMAQLDLTKDNSLHVRDQLSDVVIYTSVIFSFVPQIFLGIKLVVAVVDWYKSRNKTSRAKINKKNESKMKRITINRVATISQQPPNIMINDQSAELSMLQNSFNINLNGNESPIMKPLKPNDSPTLKREKFLLTNINSSQWEGQLIPETTNQLMKTRGSNQNRSPQKSDSSILGSKMVNNSSIVMDESDVVNSFFVNNKARERWARKKTQGNIH